MAGRLPHVHHAHALGKYHTAFCSIRSNLLRTCCTTKLLPDLKQRRKVHVNAFSKTRVNGILLFTGLSHRSEKDRTPSTTWTPSMNLLVSVQASGLHMTSRLRFSSPSDITDSIPTTSTSPLLDSAYDMVVNSAALVEPTFSSLGLGGYWPTGWIQNVLEFSHISLGLPWWGAILIVTIALRLLVLPFLINAQVNSSKMAVFQPDIAALQEKLHLAGNLQNPAKKAEITNEIQQFYPKHKINPFKSLIAPCIQLPLFASIFFGVRGMAQLPVESMKTGGILWFTDLTVTDPFFILPVVTALSTLIMFETSADMQASINSPRMKWGVRAMACMMIPYGIWQPAALLISITTTTFISNIQTYIFSKPAVKEYYGIQPKPVAPVKFGSSNENIKKGFEGAGQAVIIENAKTKEILEKKQYEGYTEPFEYKPRVKQNRRARQNREI